MMQENRLKKTIHLLLVLMALPWIWPAITAGAELDDILDRARIIEAEYAKRIHDLTVIQEGVSNIPGAESSMIIKTMSKGTKFRMEYATREEAPGGGSTLTTVVYSEGEDVIIHFGPDKTRKAKTREANLLRPEVFWWKPFVTKARLLPKETITGRNCYVLEITDREAGPFDKIWVDEKTLVQVQAEAVKKNGNLIQMVFSDFKELFPGYEVPQQTDTLVDGKIMIKMKITQSKPNRNLEDGLFGRAEELTKEKK